MITKKSNFSDYVILARQAGACEEAMAWCESKEAKYENCTFGQAMDDLLGESDNLSPQGWAIWNLEILGDQFDNEIRAGFIEKIKDPMMAFKMYQKSINLTFSEDTLLISKFESKLPVTERKLANGEIIREKDKSVG
jgi:hypothetical protein